MHNYHHIQIPVKDVREIVDFKIYFYIEFLGNTKYYLFVHQAISLTRLHILSDRS